VRISENLLVIWIWIDGLYSSRWIAFRCVESIQNRISDVHQSYMIQYLILQLYSWKQQILQLEWTHIIIEISTSCFNQNMSFQVYGFIAWIIVYEYISNKNISKNHYKKTNSIFQSCSYCYNCLHHVMMQWPDLGEYSGHWDTGKNGTTRIYFRFCCVFKPSF